MMYHLVAADRDSIALETAMERLSGFSCKKTFIHANYRCRQDKN